MKSPKNLIIVLLALATVGGALLAWRQYAELVELRAVAMNRDERSDFQKRIWELEKANRELQDQLAARAGNPVELDSLLATGTEGRADDSRRGRGGRGDGPGNRGGMPPQVAAVRELMNKPEIQAMLASQQKAGIEARYGALFKNLNLSPEQTEKLKTLLAERQRTPQDVFEAARAQGIDPRENPDAFRKLMSSARDEVENSIKAAIGDSGYAQLQNFERTTAQRSLVNEIQQRLSYTPTPLNANQAEQLVQILASNTPPRPAGQSPSGPGVPDAGPRDGGRMDFFISRGPGGGDFGRGPDFGMVGAMIGGPGGPMIGPMLDSARTLASAPITDAAVVQAQGVLSQPQVAVLQQLQQQQQTQQQLAQIVRETVSSASATTSSRGGTSGSTSGSAPPASGRTPGRRPGGK